jgi:hypothetical protein
LDELRDIAANHDERIAKRRDHGMDPRVEPEDDECDDMRV